MFIFDNKDIPNGGNSFFRMDRFSRFLQTEYQDSIENSSFKLFSVKRYDYLLDNIELFYEEIAKIPKHITPVLYSEHENFDIDLFLNEFENILDVRNYNKKIIILSNCKLKNSYKRYEVYNTNSLLNLYSDEVKKDQQIEIEKEIKKHIDTKKIKTFLSLNKNTTQDRPHRVRLLCWFIKNDLINGSHISTLLKPDVWNKSIFQSSFNEIQSLYDYSDKFREMDRLILDWDCEENMDSKLSLSVDSKNLYYESFFSIVTETSFSNTKIFISEKTPKSINNLHPFLILGDWKIHSELKNLGFVLYDDLIDYSFDNIEDNDLRFIGFTQEVQRLIDNKDTIIEWYKNNTDKLIYNYNHLLNNFGGDVENKKNIEYIKNFIN